MPALFAAGALLVGGYTVRDHLLPSSDSGAEAPAPQTAQLVNYLSSGMYYNHPDFPEYSNPSLTAEQVEAMESCGNNTPHLLPTFDDFGSEAHIRDIMNFLIENNSGAVFFPNNGDGFVSDAMIQEIRNNGFWVGNHTAMHPNLHKMGTTDEISQAIQSGVQSNLVRPPFGASYDGGQNRAFFDDRARQVIEGLGGRVCLWEIDTMDWNGPSAEQIRATVRNNLEPGAVILFHMNDTYHTLEALPGIFADARAAGFEFCARQTSPTTSDIPVSLPC